MRILAFVLTFLTLLTACVPTNSTPPAPMPTSQTLATELQSLGVAQRFIPFLSKEASQAGVRHFRPLPLILNAGRAADKPRLYGLTKRNRVVYLDGATDAGRSPFIILHEISHAAHYGGACGGHHSTWATDFAGRAERFQAQFPNMRWLGQPPTNMARELARQYGVGEKCP